MTNEQEKPLLPATTTQTWPQTSAFAQSQMLVFSTKARAMFGYTITEVITQTTYRAPVFDVSLLSFYQGSYLTWLHQMYHKLAKSHDATHVEEVHSELQGNLQEQYARGLVILYLGCDSLVVLVALREQLEKLLKGFSMYESDFNFYSRHILYDENSEMVDEKLILTCFLVFNAMPTR